MASENPAYTKYVFHSMHIQYRAAESKSLGIIKVVLRVVSKRSLWTQVKFLNCIFYFIFILLLSFYDQTIEIKYSTDGNKMFLTNI